MFEKIFGKKTETKVGVEPEIPENKISPIAGVTDIEWFRASQTIGKWAEQKNRELIEKAKSCGIVLENRKNTNKELRDLIEQKELVKNEN